MRNFDVPRHIVNYATLLLCDSFFKQTLEQEIEFPWSSSKSTSGKVYAAEPHAALALVAQRGIVDRVPTAKPKKLQNHQTELKVIICDCHMKQWQNGKQYFEEINVYFVINGDLFEKLVVCFWSKSHCYLEYKTWSIRHRPTGLCPNLRRQNYNKTRPKSVRRCSSQTYCHISMEPKIIDTKMCEYGIFVAKMGKYGIFVAQICKYGIFCREIL